MYLLCVGKEELELNHCTIYSILFCVSALQTGHRLVTDRRWGERGESMILYQSTAAEERHGMYKTGEGDTLAYQICIVSIQKVDSKSKNYFHLSSVSAYLVYCALTP